MGRIKIEREELRSFGSFETVYITTGELKKQAKEKHICWHPIHTTHPALVDFGGDKERIKKFTAAPQFAFGGGV